MANAKRCDICGSYYPANKYTSKFREFGFFDSSVIEIFDLINDAAEHRSVDDVKTTLEACPNCLGRIKRYIEFMKTKQKKNYMYERLRPHIGHEVSCVSYGKRDDPVDICIECEDCSCVLVSAETFEFEED